MWFNSANFDRNYIMTLDTKIAGKRIYLQKLQKTFKQAEEFYGLVNKNKKHLHPFADWELSLNSSEDCYERIISQYEKWEKGSAYVFGIFDIKNEKMIGIIFADRFSLVSKSTELGYWIDTNHTGKGLMKEAVELLEGELFKKGLIKVIIKTDTANTISSAVAQSLGYELEGILRKDQFIESFNELRDFNLFAKIKK